MKLPCVLCDGVENERGKAWTATNPDWSMEEIELGQILRHLFWDHDFFGISPASICMVCGEDTGTRQWPYTARHYLEHHSREQMDKAIVLREMGKQG